MKVSVIINCYNGEEYLSECLKSVESQTFQDFEIIFWDNCSTDNSAEIAKGYSKLRYYRAEHNAGLGNARKEAIKRANGEYIAFIDSDDVWNNEKLKLQVEKMDSNPDCGLILTNYINYNMMKGTRRVRYKNCKEVMLKFPELVFDYDLCTSSIMLRRSVAFELDRLFDDRLQYLADFDLFSRIVYKSSALFMPQPLITYRIHGKMTTKSLLDKKAAEFSIVAESWKNMDSDFCIKYPALYRRLLFARDLSEAKSQIFKGENKQVRQLMGPYLVFDYHATAFYIVAMFPAVVSVRIANAFYKKRY